MSDNQSPSWPGNNTGRPSTSGGSPTGSGNGADSTIAPPGWYPDPTTGQRRYWDGGKWLSLPVPGPGGPSLPGGGIIDGGNGHRREPGSQGSTGRLLLFALVGLATIGVLVAVVIARSGSSTSGARHVSSATLASAVRAALVSQAAIQPETQWGTVTCGPVPTVTKGATAICHAEEHYTNSTTGQTFAITITFQDSNGTWTAPGGISGNLSTTTDVSGEGVAGSAAEGSASASAPAPLAPAPSASQSLAASMPTGNSSPANVNCSYPNDRSSSTGGKTVATPPAKPVAGGTIAATIRMTSGDVPITLNAAKAPCTVNSFLSLATQGFFDNTPCHRLTTAGIYVLQCGDPTGTGTGGPGYDFRDEITGHDTYPAGTLAMANAGANTNGSQFFLCYGDCSALDSQPTYTVFGKVSATGLKVLQKIAQRGTTNGTSDGPPAAHPKITGVIFP